jgi:hypothetical protein
MTAYGGESGIRPDLAERPPAIARIRSSLVALAVLALASLCALLLVLPGQTVTTRYPDDLFLLLDGGYRIASGQVPNRDFHTPLGPLTFYLPGLGYLLTGSPGLVMPVATTLALLLLAPAIGHLLQSRLHPSLAIPFAAFLILILAVPMNLGEGVTALSFAKFYNRIGWVGLAALLLMFLRPRVESMRLDVAAAMTLTLVMLYTKITYGVVALAFLVFMLTDGKQRRWAGVSLGCVLLTGLVVEAFWRPTLSYLNDVLLVQQVDGSLRGSFGQMLDHFLGNISDYTLLALFSAIALWRTRSIRDAIFYVFCAVSGFLIINQNFQAWGILTLQAAAAVAAEKILRSAGPNTPHANSALEGGAQLLFLALVLPTAVQCALALVLHAGAATARAGEEFPGLDRIRIANLWSKDDYPELIESEAKMREGLQAVSALPPPRGPLVTLDKANPFSLALGLPPARGDTPWLQWGRTLDATHFPAPEQLFGTARIVMEAKSAPRQLPGAAPQETFSGLYGAYLAAHFTLQKETALWRMHVRRDAP